MPNVIQRSRNTINYICNFCTNQPWLQFINIHVEDEAKADEGMHEKLIQFKSWCLLFAFPIRPVNGVFISQIGLCENNLTNKSTKKCNYHSIRSQILRSWWDRAQLDFVTGFVQCACRRRKKLYNDKFIKTALNVFLSSHFFLIFCFFENKLPICKCVLQKCKNFFLYLEILKTSF